MTQHRRLQSKIGPVVPHALREILIALQNLLIAETREPAQIGYISNALYCYPELRSILTVFLGELGEARSIDAIIEADLTTLLGEVAQADQFFTGELDLTLSARDRIDTVAALLAGEVEEIPIADRLYYSISAKVLRDKIERQRQPDRHKIRLTAGQNSLPTELRKFFSSTDSARTAPTPLNNAQITLDDLLVLRGGWQDLTGLSHLKTTYGTHDLSAGSISASHHPENQPLIFGPYAKLRPGKYRVRLGLLCSVTAEVEFDITEYGNSGGLILEGTFVTLMPGKPTVLEHEFDWPANAGKLFESRLWVRCPRYVTVTVSDYTLALTT